MGEVDGWIPDWFPKVEKEESRKWEPVDGIQEKIICLQHFVFLFIYELETWSSSSPSSRFFFPRARKRVEEKGNDWLPILESHACYWEPICSSSLPHRARWNPREGNGWSIIVFHRPLETNSGWKKEGSVEWKRKSCVTAGKTWLIILILTVLSSARQRFIPFLFQVTRARIGEKGRLKKKRETICSSFPLISPAYFFHLEFGWWEGKG